MVNSLRGVLCVGNIVFDIAVAPVDNCDWNTTTWVDSLSEGIGGNGANTTFTLAKLGVPAKLMSAVGADERGDKLLAMLGEAGVDVSSVGRLGAPTPATVVLVRAGGDRKFLHRPGASRLLTNVVITGAAPEYSHFHFANPFAFPVLRLECGGIMREARETGLTTSIDTGWDSKGRWITDLASALPFTDILFANDAECRLLGESQDLEEAVRSLQELGVSDVIVKTGAGGCIIFEEHEITTVPGFSVNAVDSTGAGDCFVGGFLAGLSRGWSRIECARFANAVGALNVQDIGAVTGLLDFEETLSWMKSRLSA